MVEFGEALYLLIYLVLADLGHPGKPTMWEVYDCEDKDVSYRGLIFHSDDPVEPHSHSSVIRHL